VKVSQKCGVDVMMKLVDRMLFSILVISSMDGFCRGCQRSQAVLAEAAAQKVHS
jgi:hypothetical protein